MNKKLIEVALPLEAINSESAREKSIRHGHPSTLHLWWARRPLAAARAVIWASLVDDPSSHPELFPTEDSQAKERERLFRILSELVKWENVNNEHLLDIARGEILKSTGNNPPILLDPFAGGGTIPLEAQRLGLTAYAHDLNPVAVMINKAMVEIPPRFSGHAPVNPDAQNTLANTSWKGASGLSEDVSYYGEWMKQQAFKSIGDMYPTVHTDNGEATVIAWIWARTVKCPNPACGCTMPLATSFTLSKKKGKEAWVEPIFDYNNKRIKYTVQSRPGGKPQYSPKTARGAHFKCIMCGEPTTSDYIKNEAMEGRMGSEMIGVIAEGERERLFVSPDAMQIKASQVEKPENYPTGQLSDDRRALWTPIYGLDTFDKLFTNRQLRAMVTFSELVMAAREKIEQDAIAQGLLDDGISLKDGGTGARAYSEAIAVYLSFAVDREANYCSSQNGWSGDFVIQVFGRQGIPMIWDYAETNPFSNSTGNWSGAVNWVTMSMKNFPAEKQGYADQHDAQSDSGMRNILISTDPPYYDNIGYADLSDYFYIWMRNSIRSIYPDLFNTMLVPKSEELVAIPYRFGGDAEAAKAFFEEGIYKACQVLYNAAHDDYPLTIYYAFKQSETEHTDEGDKTASKGWETMLSAVIKAGFSITGTWPMHTERETGLKASVNALASSIVLVCRKRHDNARSVTRREFINALHREMRPALENLQSANIAPVDLAQSAIGPGIGVFSRYKSVLEADGKPMSVRAALQTINQELDAFYNEQEGELDRESRFCVDLFNQYAFNTIKFGDADILARAKNTSVQALADRGVLQASKGQVRLLTREEIPERVSATEECVWLLTQQLARAMEKGGVKECASIVMNLYGSNAENAKALAYRLYTICERKNWAQEGYAYNNLVVAWPDIQAMAADMAAATPIQLSLEDVLNSTQQ